MSEEHPILFSGVMVRAILDGRKTQTRRIIKPQPKIVDNLDEGSHIEWGCPQWPNLTLDGIVDLGYYAPRKVGNLLWVRENWRVGAWNEAEGAVCVDYKADNFARKEWLVIPDDDAGDRFEKLWIETTDDAQKAGLKYDGEGDYHWKPGESPGRWRSAMFMPKWAARITLEITGIRVERLKEITEEDAKAEGVEKLIIHGKKQDTYKNHLWHGDFGANGDGNKQTDSWKHQYSDYKTAIGSYSSLWELLNAKRGFPWESNPWVWVVEFKKVEANR